MLQQFCFLLAVHWFADFFCQTHWQASNKSKSIVALSRHVANYTIIISIASMPLYGVHRGFLFGIANGLLHFIQDAFTSKITAHFYKKQDWHNFFVIVGLDQLMHQLTLAAFVYSMNSN